MTTLKDLRTESLTKLKSELTLSDRLSTTAALSARTVSRRLQELMEAFRKYDKSHIKYLVRLTKEDTPINLEPHYEIVDRYDLAMDKMEALEESLEAVAKPTSIAIKVVSVKANKLVHIPLNASKEMFYSKTKTKAEGIPTRLLSLSRSVAASAHSLEKKVLAQDRANQTTKRIIFSNFMKPLEPEFVAPAEIIAPRLKRPRVNKKSNPPPCAKKKLTSLGGKRKTGPKEHSEMDSPANQDGNQVSYPSAWNKASSVSGSAPFKQDGRWWTQGGFGLALKRALWPEKLDKESYRLFLGRGDFRVLKCLVGKIPTQH